MFKDVVRRIRRGLRVTFPEFLKAVCPCASVARLRLFEFWHQQLHWCQEEASVRVFKRWRQDFEMTKERSGLHIEHDRESAEEYSATDLVVTVEDLVVAGVVTREVAEEVIQSEIDMEFTTELGENDFLHVFCRGVWGSSFEELMRKRFGALAANLQKFRTLENRETSKRSASKDSCDVDGGFPLDELVGTADLIAAFDLTDSFEEKPHHIHEVAVERRGSRDSSSYRTSKSSPRS